MILVDYLSSTSATKLFLTLGAIKNFWSPFLVAHGNIENFEAMTRWEYTKASPKSTNNLYGMLVLHWLTLFGTMCLQWSYPPHTKCSSIHLQMFLGTYARAYYKKEYKRVAIFHCINNACNSVTNVNFCKLAFQIIVISLIMNMSHQCWSS